MLSSRSANPDSPLSNPGQMLKTFTVGQQIWPSFTCFGVFIKTDRPHTKLSDDLELVHSEDKLPAEEGLRYDAGALDSARPKPGAVDSSNSLERPPHMHGFWQ